jgi:hypothetical protein
VIFIQTEQQVRQFCSKCHQANPVSGTIRG